MAQDERVLTHDEACDAYPNEWVLMQVTEHGERDTPVAGIVLAHGPTRRSIHSEVMRQIQRDPEERVEIWTFNTDARVRSFQEMSDLLDEYLRREIEGGRKRR